MQIHVVEAGQTIQSIAQEYRISASEIIKANDVPNPDHLVPGQTLVVPILGSFYTVKKGDSLWAIAHKFSISIVELAHINHITANQPLFIGMRLYIPEQKKTDAEFNAYAESFGAMVTQAIEDSARKAAPYLTYLSPFAFNVRRDGTLKPPPLGNLREIASANQNILVMVINNQEESKFSDELGKILLTDSAVQSRFLNNIVNTAKQYGFRDIHFDFEYLRPQDREAYNAFLRKARERFKQEGWFLSTALAPKTSANQKGKWYEAHDYKAHGEIVDFVVIMTYEWGYSGGPPMAVSPIGPVKDVLDFAVSVIPSNKILMGQNLYGYDWTLPFTPGKDTAKAISPQAAIQLAEQYNVPIKYDDKSEAPYIDYVDKDNKKHKVWFEDARSIQAKFELLKKLKLKGMSYWKLGLSFPQNWLLITENFHVIKK